MNRDEQIREVKSATILRFDQLWRNNFQANQNAVAGNPGVAALKNRFRDVPFIVIGAGPSLDKNLRHLRQAGDKAAIVSSDAALKAVVDHGVIPTFVVCLDPQEDIAKFLADVPHRGMTLIAPSIVHPRVLDLWQGSVLFYHKHAPDIPALTEIQARVPHIGVLTPGGTVLSIAYDLAFQAGGNPIVFMGQDLSYTRNKIYSQSMDLSPEEMGKIMARQKDNIVYEKDIFGQSRPTLKAMSVSRQWFNWAFTTWKRGYPVEIINASEAGILTDHCRLMCLEEAIYRHCRKKINVNWALQKSLKRKR